MQEVQRSSGSVTASDHRRLEDRVRAAIRRRVRHGGSARSRGRSAGMEDQQMQDDTRRAQGSLDGSPSRAGSRRASGDDGGSADRDRGDATESTSASGPRATPADAPDVPGATTLLPVGHADLPETGVGTVGEGSGGTEEGITSPATPTNEQLEPSGFDTASSDASPDLTQ